MRLGSTRRDLRADIEACGYFPDLVEDAIVLAVGEEELIDFVVHHEPTFAHDEIHRHVTVLALTPTRLIVGHTDDQPAEPPNTGSYAASSTESVSLTPCVASREGMSVLGARILTAPTDDRRDPMARVL